MVQNGVFFAQKEQISLKKEAQRAPTEKGKTAKTRISTGFSGFRKCKIRAKESARFGARKGARGALCLMMPDCRKPLKNKEPFTFIYEDKRLYTDGGEGN